MLELEFEKYKILFTEVEISQNRLDETDFYSVPKADVHLHFEAIAVSALVSFVCPIPPAPPLSLAPRPASASLIPRLSGPHLSYE